MNKIWPWLMVISVVIGMLNGKVEEMTTCLFDSAESAIETCISIFGVICLWNGLMNIAEKSGLIEKSQSLAYPLIKLLFPELKRNSKAGGSIAMNIVANVIGLGNVATPIGIKAMEELQEDNKDKTRLSKSMMMLLVLNMSSIQIIPTTVVALRASYGSENPAEIVMPVIVASFVAVLVGIILVKIFYKK